MRWHDVLADKSLQDLPYKIELNEYGNIEMSPASFVHSLLQGEIAKRLGGLSGGRVFTELAIQTSSGVRVPDVAWGSDEYVRSHLHEVYASCAPEICVEIVSPGNLEKEMLTKIRLFIDAGAREVWLVDDAGQVAFYGQDGKIPVSDYGINLENLL